MKSGTKRIASLLLCLAMLISLFPNIGPVARADENTGKTVVIYEVYGGGGNGGATLTHDYIILKNISAVEQDISGWSIQYTSGASNATIAASNVFTISADTTLEPGKYFVLQCAAGATVTDKPLSNIVTPDATCGFTLSGTSLQVALVKNATGFAGTGVFTADAAPATLADFVNIGGSNRYMGTGPAPGITNSTRSQRVAYDGDNKTDWASGPVDLSYLVTNHKEPVFTPVGGDSAAAAAPAESVALSKADGAEAEAKIYYTVNDDAIDLTTSGIEYVGPIAISGDTAIRAIVRGGTKDPSPEVTYYYKVPTVHAAPVASIPGGADGASAVKLPDGTTVALEKASGADPAAKVYYTVNDDAIDLTTGGTEYVGPITITGPTVIRAIVRGSGTLDPSPVVTWYYDVAAVTPIADARELAVNASVTIVGDVTGYIVSSSNNILFIQDGDGAFDAMMVQGNLDTSYVGQRIMVTGTRSLIYGIPMIVPDTGGVVILGDATATPTAVTAEGIIPPAREYDSALVTINAVQILSRHAATTVQNHVLNASGNVILRSALPDTFGNGDWISINKANVYWYSPNVQLVSPIYTVPVDVTLLQANIPVEANPASGTSVKSGTNVTLTAAGADSITYSINGGSLDNTVGTSAMVTLNASDFTGAGNTAVIEVYATKDSYPLLTYTLTYPMAQLSEVTASPDPANRISSPYTVTLSPITEETSIPGLKIYYTTDDSTPSESSTEYTAPFNLDFTGRDYIIVKAIAAAPGCVASDPARFVYIREGAVLPAAATPTASPGSGSIYNSTAITLTSTTPGARIHYTTNGTNPTTASPYVESGEEIILTFGSATAKDLRAIAVSEITEPSPVATFIYNKQALVLDGSGTIAEWLLAGGSGTVIDATGGDYQAESTLRALKNGVETTFTTSSGGPSWSGVDGMAGSAWWEVKTSSKGLANLQVQCGIRSSGTGPRDFLVQWSKDGVTWNNANESAPMTAGNAAWNNGQSRTLPAAAADQNVLYIRWLISSNTAANGGTIANGGTNQINNIVITGDYVIAQNQLGAPTVDVGSGPVPVGQVLTYSPATATGTPAGYAVRVRTSDDDGATWSNWVTAASRKLTLSTLPLLVEVKAAANGKTDSRVVRYSYTQAKLLPVSTSPGAGAVQVGSNLKLISSEEGATIYYKINGGAEEDYTDLIALEDSLFIGSPAKLTVEVWATKDGYLDSDPATYEYTKATTGGEQVYFGQLHSHTTNSDGAGTLEEAYDWARNNAKLDFFAVTDHSNSYDEKPSNDNASVYNLGAYNSANTRWQAGVTAAAAALDEDGSGGEKPFISIYGFEMTWSGGPGHMNTFNTEGFVSRNNAMLNNKSNDAGLRAYYALLVNTPQSISQFNHPGTTFGNFNNFAYWNAEIDERITLVEVGNGEGVIGSGGYFPSYGEYNLALDKGWHVAPTNNQDNHQKRWGNSNTARTAIWTNDLSVSGLYQAMRERRVYATEVNDLEIVYRVSDGVIDYPLGTILDDVIEGAEFKADVKTEQAGFTVREVCLVTNGGVEIQKQSFNTQTAAYSTAFGAGFPAVKGYYYIKVTVDTPDGVRYAVTAPVWMGSAKLAGFNSVTANKVIPVLGEELTITANMYNSESTAATLTKVEYKANGTTVETFTPNLVIAAGTASTAAGTAGLSYTYVPVAVGDVEMVVEATLRFADGDERTVSQSISYSVKDPDNLIYIGIDGSHYNEYVSGNYKDSMTNFTTLAGDYDVRVNILSTSADLIAATQNPKYQALILTAPTRRLNNNDHRSYSQEEINAIAAFASRGGTLILTGWSNLYESYDYVSADKSTHMSAEQNKILEAIGSTLRLSDDAVWVNDAATYSTYATALSSGSNAQRFYPTTFNSGAALLNGVVSGQTFSAYGSSSMYIVGSDGNPTGTVPNTVTPLVYNESNAILLDVELGAKTPASPVPIVTGTKYDAGGGEMRYLNTAAETVNHASGRKSLVVVSGGAFMSNFEIKIEMDNIFSLQYVNHTLAMNLVRGLAPATEITPIADVHTLLNEGDEVVIEGIVTSAVHDGSSDQNKGFFDSIYVQDATGGINLFPVASGVEVGQKIRVAGTVSSYEGERQINVNTRRLEVIDPAINLVPPLPLTVEEAGSGDYIGSLVTFRGTVKSFEPASGDVTDIIVEDTDGNEVHVFINSYITTGTTIADLDVGHAIAVTGLASYSTQVAGGNRIRIRDRAEIICSTTVKQQQEDLFLDMSTITSPVIDGTYTLATTGGSTNGDVTYVVLSGPATIVGDQLTIDGAGEIVLRAIMEGDATYEEVLSPPVTLSVGKEDQATLTVDSATLTVGGAQLTTSGGSGTGAVTFTKVSAPAGITVDQDGWVTATEVGTLVVKATKAGDRDYNPATSEDATLTVAKGQQATLIVNPVTGLGNDAGTITLTASGGTTGGAVTFTLVDNGGGICTLTPDGELTITGTGTIKVTATRAGNENYEDVTSAEREIVIMQGQSAFSVDPVTDKTYLTDTTPFQLTTTGGSGGGAVTFTKVSGPATVTSAGLVTITGAGTITVRATKAGDATYAPKTAELQITVHKAEQAELVVNLVTGMRSGDTFQLSTDGGSGTGAVTYEWVSGPATVTADGVVTATGTGTLVVKATKASDFDFNATTSPERSIELAAGGGGNGDGSSVVTPTPPPDNRIITPLPEEEGTFREPSGLHKAAVNGATAALNEEYEGLNITADVVGDALIATLPAGQDGTVTKVVIPLSTEVAREITTMAMLNADGTLVPVPTEVAADGTVTVAISGEAILVPLRITVKYIDTAGHWGEVEIDLATARMIVNGVGGARFAPDETATAAQAIVMLMRAAGLAADAAAPAAKGIKQSEWYASAMNTAIQKGMVTGGINPDQVLTRIQYAMFMFNTLKVLGMNPTMTLAQADEALAAFSDLDGLTEAERIALGVCVELGLFKGCGDGTMQPYGELQRAQIAALTLRMQILILSVT